MRLKNAAILWAAVLPAFAQNGNGVMPLTLRDNYGASAASAPSMPPAAGGIDQQTMIARYGKVIDRRLIGAGGLTAWTVEKNGHRVVLYTTADSQAIISGVVWDAATGRNLSDQFYTARPSTSLGPPMGGSIGPAAAVPAAAPAITGLLVGKYAGSIPESIKTIDTLAGLKEGKGGPADTLYVIYDPRCPYCRKAYATTREYIKRGFTIKWIPALALGDDANGAALAATILQAKPGEQADLLRRVLGNKEEVASKPTAATQEALARNLAFLHSAFQNNGVGQAGVPAGFFLDKQTGKARMMKGISEGPVIEVILGRL